MSKKTPQFPLGIWLNSDTPKHLGDDISQLAQRLSLPTVSPFRAAELVLSADQLGYYLFFCDDPNMVFRLDFDQLVFKLNVRDPLIKALGLGKNRSFDTQQPQVLDISAGWGEDAVHILRAGYSVTAIERHGLIFSLLQEAWNRSDDALIQEQLRLECADACEYLPRLKTPVPVIYFDPMFPQKKHKSTGVRKSMRFIQSLAGTADESEASSVLELARTKVSHRVVVKRPLKANPIVGPSPSGCIKGKLVRFDIYPPAIS